MNVSVYWSRAQQLEPHPRGPGNALSGSIYQFSPVGRQIHHAAAGGVMMPAVSSKTALPARCRAGPVTQRLNKLA